MQICLRNYIKDIHSTGKISNQNVSNKKLIRESMPPAKIFLEKLEII